MYEEKYPSVDDLVIVQVKNVAEMGAYVSLLEYDNIEGMILLSELSRRRIRSINKLIRVGRTEIVVVLRVDKEKGYIDLSKRRVSPEDIAKCEEKYNKSKAVHSIMRHVSELSSRNLEDLYKAFGWPLYKKYGHAYEAFKMAISEESVLNAPEIQIDEEVKDILLKDIRRRLTPQASKLRADFEVTCFQYNGIDAIKAALLKGQALSTTDVPIKIKLVAPPLFVMVSSSSDKENGIKLLTEALETVKAEIQKCGGDLTVKTQPRAVSEREDRELVSAMEEAERANQEVSGDNDISDNEDEAESE